MIVDARSGLGTSSKSVQFLKKEKINVLFSGGIELLHYKHLIVDDQILVSGSTNWTKAAFQKNHDCFFILYDLTDKQRDYLNNLQKIIMQETH